LLRTNIQTIYQEEVRLRSGMQDEIDKRTKYTRALVHELKTPLTSILASSELLESEAKEAISQALIKNLRRAAFNLENRINDLIDLARGETGRLHIVRKPIDIYQLINDITKEINPMAAAKGLKMEVSLVQPLPIIQVDKIRLSQVITNLLSNAIKYTTTGKIIFQVTNYDENYVLFKIEDTGRGIDAEHMEFLFDPYRRKPSGGMQFSGIGIGLPLSKMYVELHEGKIWADSTYGRGSTFSFTIPVSHDSMVTNKAAD
jgi:signal transduction histidine kinase